MLPTSCGFGIDIPLPEFELDITEMDFIDPEQQLDPGKEPPKPEPEVLPPPMGPELPPPGEGPKPEDKPPEPPKPKVFGEKASKVDQLGPTGSNFYALLNAKKVAPLKFAGVDRRDHGAPPRLPVHHRGRWLPRPARL
jgi:hypothetical protein